jgi:hypothetical protein
MCKVKTEWLEKGDFYPSKKSSKDNSYKISNYSSKKKGDSTKIKAIQFENSERDAPDLIKLD